MCAFENFERSGKTEKFEDAKLQELLDEKTNPIQNQLAEALTVAQEMISNRLQTMGENPKSGNQLNNRQMEKSSVK